MQAASNDVIRSDQVISAGMKCTLCDKVACLSQESHWGFYWPTLSRVQKKIWHIWDWPRSDYSI